MKKFIIFLVIAGMSLFLPTSCLKQYLDKAPQQGLTSDQIFTKLDNFKLYFDAVYAGTKYVGTAWDDYNIKTAFPLYFGPLGPEILTNMLLMLQTRAVIWKDRPGKAEICQKQL